MRVIESFGEFAFRMGCESVAVTRGRGGLFAGRDDNPLTGDLILFANGAVSDGKLSHAEPPEDPKELLARKRDYLKAVLRRDEKVFQAYQAQVLLMADLHEKTRGGSPPMPLDAPANLKRASDHILGLRAELATVEEALVDREALTDKAARERQKQAADERFKQRVYEYQGAVQAARGIRI